MATIALTDAQIHVDGIDLTGYMNQVALKAAGDELDVTNFASGGWRERIGGVLAAEGTMNGFMQTTAEPDATLFADLAASSVMSIASTATTGAAAWMFNQIQNSYEWGGKYGDAAEWNSAVGSSGIVVAGGLLWPKADVTGAANGTGKEFSGGAAADESLYLAVHVLSAGTTCDVIVESDSTSGFSTPTTRITETVTAAGGTWSALVGPITDTWFRVRFANVTGTFSIAATVGIG